MTTFNWATVLDRLFDDPADPEARTWAERACAESACTPGQRRAFDILAAGQDVIGILEATPQAIATILASADERRIASEPIGGGWSPVQIIHHFADNEAVNAVRIRSILTEDTPTIFGYDSDPWTRFFDLEPHQDAVDRFTSARRNTVVLARSLSPADLDRRGVLSYRGVESLRVLLAVLAGHDRDHLDHLTATLTASAG
jgi:hypothetical protein